MRGLVRGLVVLTVIGALGVAFYAPNAEACWGRHCGCCSCYSSCCAMPVVVAPLVPPPPVPNYFDVGLRQCRGMYFDPAFSVWTQVDVLVPYYEAAPGLSTFSFIPGIGNTRVWIADVYMLPHVAPPPFGPVAPCAAH